MGDTVAVVAMEEGTVAGAGPAVAEVGSLHRLCWQLLMMSSKQQQERLLDPHRIIVSAGRQLSGAGSTSICNQGLAHMHLCTAAARMVISWRLCVSRSCAVAASVRYLRCNPNYIAKLYVLQDVAATKAAGVMVAGAVAAVGTECWVSGQGLSSSPPFL